MSASSGRSRRAALIAAVAAASAIAALTVTPATALAAGSGGGQQFPGAVPKWATPANDAGTAPAAETLEAEIYLPLRDEAKAQQLATAVSTPADPQYRHWLSPQQWINTFSPTQADLKAVTDFVTSSGFTVTAVPQSRQYVVFRGPVAAMNTAFSTSLHNYRYANTTLSAPSSPPTVPAALASKISGVSLDQGRLLNRPAYQKQDDSPGAVPQSRSANPPPPPASAPVDAPCSHFYGEHTATVPKAYGKTSYPTRLCGYTPGQLRSAYGLNPLINSGVDGSGQTVAIVDAYASPSIVADANSYSQQVGAPLLNSRTYSQIVPKPAEFSDQAACAQPSGWQTEQTLDVEAAHGVAPGAHLLYVGGFNCGGGLDIALSKILDGKLANIVSNSYGNLGEAVSDTTIAGQQNQHLQAAAEGIGLYFSSGDSGDEQANLGYKSPDFPASSPYVTSVGGTSLGVAANGGYQFEAGWGSTRDEIVKSSGDKLKYTSPLPGAEFRGGAGGGVSADFDQPAYQQGTVPDALASGPNGPARVSPDIASLADPYTGYLIGLRPIVDDQTLQTGPYANATYGGTSLASPLTAAQIAIVQQQLGGAVGFANPSIYALHRSQPSVFRDVTPQNPPKALAFSSPDTNKSYLVTLDRDSSLATAPGYDDVTGLGSLSPAALNKLVTGQVG